MSSKILVKTERFGIKYQADWATPGVAGEAFKLCPWINSGTPNPNPDVQVEQFNVTSQSGIHHEAERFFIDATSGLPTIPFSGTCEKATMAAFLVGAFQGVTEAAGTPYLKTITCGGLTAPIDFKTVGKYLFTIAVDQGGSADDGVILDNAIIQNLNIVWDLNAKGIARLVNMSGAWVGNKLTYEQDLSSGTPWANLTPIQTGFFNNTDLWGVTDTTARFLVDAVDYSAECIRKVEYQINNNVTSNCKTTGGKADQYDITPEYKTIITLDYNATTEKILKDFTTGSEVGFIWGNDSAGARTDGKWAFKSTVNSAVHNGRLMSPPKQYNGDFIGIQLDVRWYSQLAGTPLTVYYVDTVDWTF
jgi:hypothetical protein